MSHPMAAFYFYYRSVPYYFVFNPREFVYFVISVLLLITKLSLLNFIENKKIYNYKLG